MRRTCMCTQNSHKSISPSELESSSRIISLTRPGVGLGTSICTSPSSSFASMEPDPSASKMQNVSTTERGARAVREEHGQ